MNQSEAIALEGQNNTRIVKPSQRVSGLLIGNQQMGMLLFVVTEVMFFMALVSAHIVIKAASPGAFHPPYDLMLPREVSLFNTFILLASGILMWWAARLYQRDAKGVGRGLYFLSIFLGLAFVSVQGSEWSRLIEQGLTFTSGVYGACFYLLVGSHAIHAFLGALALGYHSFRLARGTLSVQALWSLQIYWSFVVLIWPILFFVVYV